MEWKSFDLIIKGGVAHLAFDRAEKANALDLSTWEEMRDIFVALDQRKDVRVIILSGHGKHFCAGMDLQALMSIQQTTTSCPAEVRDGIRSFILNIQDCITSIERCRKPVIAAIHGGCIGGGVDIVSACDMRYSTMDAYFTIKEVDLGIVADIGTLQRLPQIIAPGIMAELAFTGRKCHGNEAKSIGLVNEIFSHKDEMMTAVSDIAETIATKSPLVIRGIKETLLYQRDHSVQDGLQHIAQYNSAMLLSEDLNEAFQSYLEKRPPQFKDS